MRNPFLLLSALLAAPVSSAIAQSRPAAEYIALIEGAQPGADSLGRLTIPELMRAFNVPGMSVAVIQDSRIHWASSG